MGTDILLWVEVLNERRWEFGHRWWMEPFKTPSGMLERLCWESPYDERNYDVFALLANVRNDRGLVTPLLREPRGMPTDLSDLGRRIVGEWELGGISALSWVGADELLTHDWDTPGGSIVVASQEEADEYRRTEHSCAIEPIPMTGASWVTLTRPERHLCKDFVERFLPTLPSYGPPDRTRVCFFFFP